MLTRPRKGFSLEAEMGKKNKKPLIEWQQEQQAAQEPEKPMTREEIVKALDKVRKKRPRIKSSHGGG